MPDHPPSRDPVPRGAVGAPGRARGSRTAALPFALAAATGVAAGALVAPGADGPAATLAVPTLPGVELGVRFGPMATSPDGILGAAVDGLGLVVGSLGGLTMLVALASAATLLAAAGSLRRRELAVRGALGRPPAALVRLLLRRDGGMLAAGLLAGVLAGLGAAGVLHGAWPFARPDGALLPWEQVGRVAVVVSAACLGVGLALTLLPVRYGVRGLAGSLAAGSRATADPREGGLRRIATVFQIALSLALLSSSVVLWRALPERGADVGGSPGEVILLPADVADGGVAAGERAAAYRELLDRLGSLSTVASESIASPGAWTGIGTSDFVLADCGACRLGTMWVPFLGADARHHAVSPGFFESAGMELLDGRDFTLADGPGAELVAVISEPLARDNFENGDPLGRQLRVGEGMEGWYTVVGVVRESRPPGLGLPDRPPPAVYLSLLQHPPDRVEVGFRPASPAFPATVEADGPLPAVRSATLAAGFAPAPRARTAGALLEGRARPLGWAAVAAALLGSVALVSAVLGVQRVGAVEVAARRRELGIRLALGCGAAGLTRWVLGRAFRSALLASVLAVPPSIAVTARLRETVGDVPLFDPVVFPTLAALLVGAAVAGVWRPARRAAALDPALVMSEE